MSEPIGKQIFELIRERILTDGQAAAQDARKSPKQREFIAEQSKRLSGFVEKGGKGFSLNKFAYEVARHSFYLDFALVKDALTFELMVRSKRTTNFCEAHGFTFRTNANLPMMARFGSPMLTRKGTLRAEQYHGKALVVLVKPKLSAILKVRDDDRETVPFLMASVRDARTREERLVVELSNAHIYRIEDVFELEAYAVTYDWLRVLEDNRVM